MFRSLLVPLDGSSFAEHALPWALSIARRTGAALNLAQVHTMALFYDSTDLPADAAIREQEVANLQDVAKRLADVSPVRVNSALLDGPIPDALHAHAKSVNADLIVMTTHGRGALSRLWLGSVADRLVRRTPVPILLIRPKEGSSDIAQDPVLQRILVPLDGSALAEQILEPALALGSAMKADYCFRGNM